AGMPIAWAWAEYCANSWGVSGVELRTLASAALRMTGTCSVGMVPMSTGCVGCVAMSTGAGGAPPPPPVGPLELGGAPSELGGETLLGPSMLPTGPALKPGGWGAPG